ncbi:MAG: hypothetical protein HY288_09705 [Planctomycetia bacterium]|nr:hypothetical protein [Planctomycetia bacterium]
MKRFWRPLKFAGLGLVALVALFVIYAAVADYRASTRLERKLAQLRAAGEPTQLADLAREPIRPENNAATYFDRAESGILAIDKEVWATYEAASEVDQKAFDALRLTPAMQNSIRSSLDAYPQAIALLERAADCTDYDPQLIMKDETGNFLADLGKLVADQLPKIQNQRAAMRVLDYHALLMLADGKPEEALRDTLVMLRLSRKFEQDAMMVGYLVAVACRNIALHRVNEILRLGPIPDPARKSLDLELSLADEIESYRRALKRERIYGMQMFREMSLGRSQFVPINLEWLLCGMFKNDECSYLDLVSEQIAEASGTSAQFDEAKFRNAGTLTRSVLPGIQAFHSAKCHDEARIRCLRILNAIQRHGPIGVGALHLADLGLPAEATIDPFNGEALNVKKTDDGWLVYSVGKNLKDDGGKLDESMTDVGLGPYEPSPPNGNAEEGETGGP